ncbi:unnamed protein product [[Candida] boidinii]|nr:unnamed protein product [[Candida] boidinii]
MDCCGDISDSTVDWYNIVAGTLHSGTTTVTVAGSFIPIRIVSLTEIDVSALTIEKPSGNSVSYTELIYNLGGVSTCPSKTTSSVASISAASSVAAVNSCTNLSTDLPTGFSSTTRVITPQWITDSGYTNSLILLAALGYAADDQVTVYEYSGYIYASNIGAYIFNSVLTVNILTSHSALYYGEQAGMDCCGDLSDASVDWYNILAGTYQTNLLTTLTSQIFIPVRILSLVEIDFGDVEISAPYGDVPYEQIVYHIEESVVMTALSALQAPL